MCIITDPGSFITFMCNPPREEIANELMYGIKVWSELRYGSDRHDLTARVFCLKLIKSVSAITESQIFGETVVWMYSVECKSMDYPVHIYYCGLQINCVLIRLIKCSELKYQMKMT